MAEFRGAGSSPLTAFLSCLYDQQEALTLADERRGGDWLTVGEVARDIMENGQHEVLFQAAYHADKSPTDKLSAALDAHKSLLRTAWAYSQGDSTQLEFGLAHSGACQAVSDLLPYLTPPGQREAHHAHLEKLFPKRVPDDPHLRDSVLAIQTDWESYKCDRDIIRKITQEPEGDCPRAKRIESKMRKLRGDGNLTLPGRRERTKRTT